MIPKNTSKLVRFLLKDIDKNGYNINQLAKTLKISPGSSLSVYTVNVTYVIGSGSFTASDSLRVEFTPKGDIGNTGAGGSAGANGTDGVSSGNKWLWDATTSMADPGAGDLRLNNATLASVTAAADFGYS